MVLSVPTAAFCRTFRSAWPLLVAALLTLLLGWCALHEGRGTLAAGQDPHVQHGGAPLPPGDPAQLHAMPAGEAESGKVRGGKPALPPALCQLSPPAPPARGNVRPTGALLFHLPPLRQPPGHAPPLQA